MIVWTIGYRPFLMGGDVNGPIGVDIEVGEKFDLGKSIFGYLVASPVNGKTFVAESTTGAFVGPDIETVRSNIANAGEKVMKKQLAEAEIMRNKVDLLDPEKFWSMFKDN